MTKKTKIGQIKLLAKRLAHATRSSHRNALDAIATELGFPHWKALTVKASQGWMVSEDDLGKLDTFVSGHHPSLGVNPEFIKQSKSGPVEKLIKIGEIDGHAYQVYELSGDIRMEGEGWRILIGEADFSQPIVEIESTHKEVSPASDRGFVDKALEVAENQATKVRAAIASDWPRRSTKPDAKDNVLHPITGDKAAIWFCLHCDGKMTGPQVAENLWHCPRCNASPLDIFASPWWLAGSDEKPTTIRCVKERPEHKIELVDSRPTLKLDEQSVSLLLRIALIEDANTPAERLGALMADISVDDECDALITLDIDLWPEHKDPEAAVAVANKLNVSLDFGTTCCTFPFAWPGLGQVTTSTSEYVQLMLNAYEEQGVILGKKDD